MSQKRILVFGLSANPVHQAHVDLVAHAANALQHRGYDIAEALLIPVYRRNPVGTDAKESLPSTFEHRCAMCQLAAEEIRKRMSPSVCEVRVSRIEERLAKERDESNYSAVTLATLSDELSSNYRLVFLMSSDLVSGENPEFSRWHRPDSIVQLATLAICPRSGYEPNLTFLETLKAKGADLIYLEELPSWPVSATAIRERIESGEDPFALSQAGLLPESVAAYVKKHALYGSVKKSRRSQDGQM